MKGLQQLLHEQPLERQDRLHQRPQRLEGLKGRRLGETESKIIIGAKYIIIRGEHTSFIIIEKSVIILIWA